MDRLLVFGSNGRIYTIACDKISRGRGFGEPLRLMIDLADEAEIVALHVYKPGKKLLLASSDGRGFIVPTDEVLAQTRAGRQVLNLDGKATGQLCVVAEGDLVAVSGTNRKLVIYPLSEIPEMKPRPWRCLIQEGYSDRRHQGFRQERGIILEKRRAHAQGGGYPAVDG